MQKGADINMKKPNILILMTDQQRFNALGCCGCEAVQTPNIDRLASEGALFSNCYINNPLCTPSRASLMTGNELPGHKVYRLHDNLPDNQVLFPERLQEIGYITALFGKLHVCGIEYEVMQKHPHNGFDVYGRGHGPKNRFQNLEIQNCYAEWLKKKHPDFLEKELESMGPNDFVPQEVHYNHWVAESTIDFIKERDKEKPFFCLASIVDPHNPYTNHPESALKTVAFDKIPKPHSINDNMTPEYIKMQMKDANVDNEHYRDDLQKMREGYLASIGYMDIEYGRIIDTLEREGILDDTLIIFVSDHGDMLGDHGLFIKGAFFYDECAKVPLIMRYPKKIKPGVKSGMLVQPHDIAATILTEAGYDKDKIARIMPTSCDLMPFLAGEKDESEFRDYAVCMYRISGTPKQENMVQRYLQYRFDVQKNGTCPNRAAPPYYATMIRYKQFKATVFHSMSVSDADLHGELYDMDKDPKEQNNLWSGPKYDKVKLDMMLRMMNWMVKTEL